MEVFQYMKKISVVALLKAKFDKALYSMFTQEDELDYYLSQAQKAKAEQIESSKAIIEGELKTKDRLLVASKALDNLTVACRKEMEAGKTPDDPAYKILLTKAASQQKIVENLEKSYALTQKASEESKAKLSACELTIASIEAQATVIRSQIETYKTTSTYDPKALNLGSIEKALNEMSIDIRSKTEANAQVNEILDNNVTANPEASADAVAFYESLKSSK